MTKETIGRDREECVVRFATKRPRDALATASSRVEASSRVGIVVLHYNGLDDTLECLESLRPVHSERTPVWVVDNASDEDPREAIRTRFPWCRIVRNPINGGWAGGNNYGIRYALKERCDWVLLLNNDTRVDSSLVDRLTEAAGRDDRIGVIGPLINEWDPVDKVQTAACFFNRSGHDGMLQPVDGDPCSEGESRLMSTDIVNGCCMMIRSSVIEQIGEIDERFFLVHEESDFCLRAKSAGFSCQVLVESLVWHKHSVTFGRDPSPLQRYYGSRNAWLLIGKHRHFPGVRGRWASCQMLLRHAWYLIDHDLESGRDTAARAVVDGTADAWVGRFGPKGRHRRPLAWTVSRILFPLARCRQRFRGWRTDHGGNR